jgi:hypothetical protein
MTRGTTVKMIQLSTLTLLLAAGLFGSAWANAPKPEPRHRPVVESVCSALEAELIQPTPLAERARTYYVWDRVGRPLGKESFFI